MTTWGAWTSDGRLRAGLALSISPSTVSHTTSSVTVSWTLYGESEYASNESGSTATPWAISGSHSGSGYGQGWNVGGGGTWVVASGSYTVSTSYTSSITETINGHYSSSYAYPGDTAYVSASITIPKRPIAAPAAPTGCAWARTSDTQQTVSWANTSATDSSAPYTNVHVQRLTDAGSWVEIAKLGVVTSYTDKGTSASHRYQYRVYASNSAGNSGYSTSSIFYTTPNAPSNCTAAKTATGDIVVTWTDNAMWNDTFAVWHAANGVWDASPLTSSVPNGTNTYTHSAPSTSVTHSYRVTAHAPTPSLTSAYSATSNTVQLLAAPNAPTSLAPNGQPADATFDLGLSWMHNSSDTTPQRKFEVQYQVDGGAWTSMGVQTSTSSTLTVVGGTWGANGHTVGWQVRTWGSATTGGSDGTGASAWSATASVTLSSEPTVVISSPGPSTRTVTDGATTANSTTVTSASAGFDSDDVGASISGGSIPAGATITGVTDSQTVTISAPATATATGVAVTIDDTYPQSHVTVSWGYAQAEGSPQSQWFLELYDATGATLLESLSGTGTTSTATLSTQVLNNTSYQVGVIVQSAAGLESLESFVTFTISYALPPTPTITGLWQASAGTVGLTVNVADPVSPQVAADHLQVWRSLDAGATWSLVADNVVNGATVNDAIPALRSTNTYMAVAVTTMPSQAVSSSVDVDTTPGCHHVWVNAGPGFAQAVCFTTSVDISDDEGVEKALNRFAGRTKPVETMGEQTEQSITLRAVKYDPLVASAIAAETSSLDEIAALSKLAAPACVRTPDGMRVFVSTGIPSFGGLGTAKVRSIQWAFTEVDYAEPVGIPG